MRILFSYLFIGLTALNTVNFAMAQPAPDVAPMQNNGRPPEPTPAEAIPQDITAFVEALNHDDSFFRLATYVAGAKIGFFGGQELLKEWVKLRGTARLQVTKVEANDLKDNDAKARVTYIWTSQIFNSEPIEETLIIHRAQAPMGRGRVWQIVPVAPVTAEGIYGLKTNAAILGMVAQSLVAPQQSLEALRGAQSTSNLKQLSLGALQFVQDYDETYAFAPEYTQEALKPYLPRDPKFWEVPGHPTETYTFNGNLSALSLAALKAPAKTILFYEGEEQPKYRYNGKAAIAFADGHVKLVSPDEMKQYIWKP